MAFLDGNSCSYSCNSDKVKKHAYIDPKYLAAQQEKAAATEAWTGLGISLFLGLTGSVIQGIENGDFKSSSGVEVEDRTVAEIEADIQKILDEVECTSISDVDIKRETYEYTLEDAKRNQPELDKTVKANTAALKYAKKRSGEIPNEIRKVKRVKELEEEALKNQGQYTSSELEDLNAQLSALEQEQLNNQAILDKEEDFNKQEKKLGELNKIIKDYPSEIKKLDKASENLKKLDKQLKKAEKEEAKDSLKNNLNDDTKQISDIIKKLNNANSNGWDKKTSKHYADAREAIVNYYQNHNKGDNTTIDRLAKTMGFDLDTEKFKDKK